MSDNTKILYASLFSLTFGFLTGYMSGYFFGKKSNESGNGVEDELSFKKYLHDFRFRFLIVFGVAVSLGLAFRPKIIKWYSNHEEDINFRSKWKS